MNSKTENPHVSVLLEESVEWLEIRSKGLYIDATLGFGGHTEAILKKSPDAEIIAFDQDAAALNMAGSRLEQYKGRVKLVHANFSSIRDTLIELGTEAVDGVIADLGVSSMQLDSETRGFSFRFDAPLDMRMDPESNAETVEELLARLSEVEIADVIYQLGEERFSRRIAKRIVMARENGEPVKSTVELANLVRRAVPKKRNERVHPATKTFQALRIKVNAELEILEGFIRDAVDLLKPGGRMVVITFHSLEDRIVKRTFQNLSGRCFCPRGFPKCVCGSSEKVKVLTRKPVIPSESEQQTNRRSRSAKLRAVSKLDPNN